MATAEYIKETTAKGYGGSNIDINKRLNNTFNQWTRAHDDPCSYVNEMRILQKPMKYYVAAEWAPSPTNQSDFITYTPIGNQKAYNVSSNFTYPGIGDPTTLRNRRYIENVMPLNTSPNFASTAINTSNVDVDSNLLGFGIGDLTNQRDLVKDLMSLDYNRWDFVQEKTVFGPSRGIFANGVIPVGGLSSRNELQTFLSLNSC